MRKFIILNTACGARRTTGHSEVPSVFVVPLRVPVWQRAFDAPSPSERNPERRFQLMRLIRDAGTGEVNGGEYEEIVE